MSLHRYSSTIIRIKDVSTCFYYSLTSATASLQRLIVCYGKGFVMSGVFAASLQGAAVWKSRVPQKWFNPNYPVSLSASAPSPLLSCPHAAIFCRWISTYNVTFAAVNCEIWNQRQSEITSSRNKRPLFWCCSFTTRVNHASHESAECGYWAGIFLEAVSPAAARHNAAVPWPDVTETAAASLS